VESLVSAFLHVAVAGFGLRLAVIDQQFHRLPDRLTGPLAALVLGWGIVFLPMARFGEVLGETAVTVALFALCALMPGRPLGWGDVKLQVGLGFYTAALVPGGCARPGGGVLHPGGNHRRCAADGTCGNTAGGHPVGAFHGGGGVRGGRGGRKWKNHLTRREIAITLEACVRDGTPVFGARFRESLTRVINSTTLGPEVAAVATRQHQPPRHTKC
jgi:hypothetical protein